MAHWSGGGVYERLCGTLNMQIAGMIGICLIFSVGRALSLG